jgi:hypothetical protein
MKFIEEFYVDNANLSDQDCSARDKWCFQTFGEYRHDTELFSVIDTELDEGWWLQSEEEYVFFNLRWHNQDK